MRVDQARRRTQIPIQVDVSIIRSCAHAFAHRDKTVNYRDTMFSTGRLLLSLSLSLSLSLDSNYCYYYYFYVLFHSIRELYVVLAHD